MNAPQIARTRSEALASGQITFSDGLACRHGHIAPKYARRRGVGCTMCDAAVCARHRAKNLQHLKDKQRARRLANLDAMRMQEADLRKIRMTRLRAEGGAKLEAYNARRNKESRAQVQRNPAKALERQRNWCARNREIKRAYGRNRYARQISAAGEHTGKEILALGDRQRWRCVNCGICIRNKFEADHIVPLFLSGRNDIQNIQLLCCSCNRQKSCKHPIAWAQENGRLL